MTRIFLDGGKDSEKSKRLEEISLGDSLFFPNCRIEKVVAINRLFKELYTERIVINKDGDFREFPNKQQEIIYELSLSGTINSYSKGRVYGFKKIKREDWEILTNLNLNKVPAVEGTYK